MAPTSGNGAPSDAKSPLGSTARPPKDAPPNDVPPKDVSPKDAPSKDIHPKDMPSKDVPPKDASPKDTPSKDVAPRDVLPKDVTPKDVPPKGDRATPAAASPSSAASPRPKQGGFPGEGGGGGCLPHCSHGAPRVAPFRGAVCSALTVSPCSRCSEGPGTAQAGERATRGAGQIPG